MQHGIQYNSGDESPVIREDVSALRQWRKPHNKINGRIHTGEDESSNKIAEEESSHKTTK